MSYQGISVKDAINRINNGNNGWFLPAIQRPYVWGSRYESEAYICKLFDSILNEYPIGGLIVWNTKAEIPYREFMGEYEINSFPKIVDKGLHGRSDKWLVYDGQQRLQTLYSCLKYTFNGSVLIFDLLFDSAADEVETGFSFIEKNGELPWHKIRMNELFSRLFDDKYEYRETIFTRSESEIGKDQKKLTEQNLDKLFDTFVKYDSRTLAYFEIKEKSEEKVNEIFERLNTGGMALSQADLLLSKIKARHYDFEEKLQKFSATISKGFGYDFSAYSLLQLAFLIVKGTIRVDPKKVSEKEVDEFPKTWGILEKPITSFFSDYLWGQFKINKTSLIPRQQAILPILVYFYEVYKKDFSFKQVSSGNLTKINTYFIKSQINDWNLQSYVDNFSRIIKEAADPKGMMFDFPIGKIEEYVTGKGNRFVNLTEQTFVGYTWFALKILTPSRSFNFSTDLSGRFNPEIDHIFPVNLESKTPGYDDVMDIIWNKHPTKGEINLLKSNNHPRDFFKDNLRRQSGEVIVGSKYMGDYDFLPRSVGNSVDLNSPLWDDITSFVHFRRKEMIDFFESKYSLKLE